METPLADPPRIGADPVTHVGHARRHRIVLVLRRLVGALVGLNLLVLVMLVAVTLVAGGDDTADGATESSDPTDEPDAEGAASEPTTDGTAADPAENADAAQADGAVGDPAEPVDEVPTISTEPPPHPEPFEPTVNEVQPDAKRMGGLVAHLITNYEADSSLADVLATLPPGSSQIEGLVAEVELVHHPGMWSRGAVEYVQLGGHLNGRISNFVVIRQDIGVEGSSEPERTETRAMEVHLARGETGEWTLETIASAGGVPAERPVDLSEVAAGVVDHERIDLPDTAAWDIYRGFIDRQLLEVMLDIAERTPYSVVVLQTGHSYNVFGTDRVSNHSVGRAVDIYKLDTELMVDSHATWSDSYALSEWIVSRYDIREFGSPWRFPDAVAHTFANEVHHDHIHIGVSPYPTSPGPVEE
jgi:hypothetical protein